MQAIAGLPVAQKRELVALLEERERRKRTNRLATYRPYPKQAEFHALGATVRERLLMAGNQLGKTWSAGFEAAMHATGLYPDDWQGRRWDRPTVGWAASETMEVSRDAGQRILLGREGERGIGAIPESCILDVARYPNVRGAISQAWVRHVSGGQSLIIFKSYDQGRRKFQGDTIDWFWPDEEPPEDIYSEGLTRTNATGGMVMMTFTPLLGMSRVVQRFLKEKSPDRAVVQMGIKDALHYTQEERDRIIASYPEHEREARTQGLPMLGEGAVFPIAREKVAYDAGSMPIPDHWPRICGIDFGWDHPTAAAWLAWDRDADVIYVYDCYAQTKQTPVFHAAAIKGRGDWIPVAWPHDGLQHDKGSGEQLADQYRAQGLEMLPERATFDDGSNGVEAGVMEMLDRMQTGRLKIASHLEPLWDEIRGYHREKGRIVKINDDIISAVRYALMMIRHAKVPGRKAGAIKFKGAW
ncbi:terminase large subunit [Lysobacter sp. GX 14042]|uniref:terminase large subunit domain-containing protein n=1 Tax=Lysobacter sp. GX 14042 TaxID=2907155 RepID=UPI001F17C1B2|nr:terminase family protein [Lysobacter sp. GX 14042]MCE7031744.1 terminase large subunit [Lysobacter sp. GX 14042]